jgi:hypothetical protein
MRGAECHGQTIAPRIAGARLIGMAIAYRGAGSIPQRRPPLSSLAEETMSPTIFTESFMEPIQVPGRRLGRGGGNFYDRLSASRPANWFLGFLRLFGCFRF